MSEVVPRKQEKDYSKEVDDLLPVAESLASDGKLQEAIDKLLALEKGTRNASDQPSTSRLLMTLVTLPYKHKNLELAFANISVLSKKHGQIRQSVTMMVDATLPWLDELPEGEMIKLIEVLREVTEGKIYLEVQRARVTRRLSKIREQEGKIDSATELLVELQVETFGSMSRREKIDFILEQMRLLHLKQDWDQMAITSKKVNVKWIEDKDNEDLKLRYYALVIILALHGDKYLDLCKHYRQIYDTPSVIEDETKWQAALRNVVYFIVLAPYDNEQSDLLARISQDSKLQSIPECYNLAKCFTSPELMRWPGIQELYGPQLRQTKVFGPNGVKGVTNDIDETIDAGQGDKRWEALHNRVIEHNIRTIAKYYTRITIARLAELLDLDTSNAETMLSKLVVSKMVYAKIDRPQGTVNFVEKKSTDSILNDWSSDISKLMGLIDKSTHLIAKEHAVFSAQAAQASKA
ncbi:uncharacterized protein L969DRAFT_83888 [Mixia osmundae IAM 14324]|uniref:PCI domain-containing protein n=1 Tax=Mixia osmundae (strain CBS 9802 / IAM 14324 / JCM 22182 / KY 12970) TaxID=764103 RepID=G7DVD6_MIXOS|nr:uncharacterized protein L969DRAFT_83888 [Mixia osmundae IAM 14324]KEI42033.1 hypothetical protein L969DRAFT_83888 [Mixia osmundae IAM 14324]GAA94546.1 hypothetical protein E5Q_01198 [Mixia osmundae IAM 14324]